MDISEAMNKIKSVGASHVRTVPMPGMHVVEGMYQIEVLDGSSWLPIVTSLPKTAADSIVAQAVNRTLLG